MGASLNRGRSKQDWGTPPALLVALKKRLGIEAFDLDLAASAENAIADTWYDEADDALSLSWASEGWNFCNPPYADIAPWVEKAFESRGEGRIAMLLPASIGSQWWHDWVHGKAYVLALTGRLTFVGATTPYPKDTVILLYDKRIEPGYECWKWADE